MTLITPTNRIYICVTPSFVSHFTSMPKYPSVDTAFISNHTPKHRSNRPLFHQPLLKPGRVATVAAWSLHSKQIHFATEECILALSGPLLCMACMSPLFSI